VRPDRTTKLVYAGNVLLEESWGAGPSSDGWDYKYDREGNLVSKSRKRNDDEGRHETWRYEYDHANRLVGVRQFSTLGTDVKLVLSRNYTYDALGRRVSESGLVPSSGGVGEAVAWTVGLGSGRLRHEITHYAYDGPDVFADLNSDGTLQARYLRGDGVDELWGKVTPGASCAKRSAHTTERRVRGSDEVGVRGLSEKTEIGEGRTILCPPRSAHRARGFNRGNALGRSGRAAVVLEQAAQPLPAADLRQRQDDGLCHGGRRAAQGHIAEALVRAFLVVVGQEFS
jgi:YD repeat-containing protein